MTNQPETLGGRLPLLDAQKLTSGQKGIYDLLDNTLIPWAASSGFQSKTETGKFIGPFNPLLFSPGITRSFVQLQIDEAKNTTLTERVRQVIILTVGAVWQSDYERYAHAAVARKAGISEEAIRTLMAGGLPDDLSEPEKLAQRYTLQLATEHRIDTALYHEAEQAFGQEGLVNLAYLAGIYHLVCGLLNSFEIPAPA
jgi:4-carboxymuconolactone decarboxylase